MEFADSFPIWNKLSSDEQKLLTESVYKKKIPAKTVIHNGNTDCMGMLIVQSGQLRAYICSDEGKEITVYRLFEFDMCLFSASCMMNSIQFDIAVSAEKDTEVWVIPINIYQSLMEKSAVVSIFKLSVC